MNEQHAAFGLIKISGRDQTRYLLQYNRKWLWFNLIGGKIEAGETPWQAIVREIEEELNLVYQKDFTVLESPLAFYETTEFSKREQIEKHYKMHFFEVNLLVSEEELVGRLSANPENLWVTCEEIQNGFSKDGKALSYLVRDLLRAAGRIL